jgi:hypothetical protein
MIEVELPDGAIAEFPDGTPPDVIKGALRKKFGAPAPVAADGKMDRERSYSEYGMDALKGLGTGVVKGVEQLAGGIGDAQQMTGDVMSWGAGKLGFGEQGQQIASQIGQYLAVPGVGPNAPRSEDISQTRETMAGPLPTPETDAGGAAQRVGEFAPGLISKGGLIRKGANVVIPALSSYFAGKIPGVEGTAAQPYVEAGAALATGIPAATAFKGNAVKQMREAAPSYEKVAADTTAAYKTIKDAKIVYDHKAYNGAAMRIISDLRKHGYDPAAGGEIVGLENRVKNLMKSGKIAGWTEVDSILKDSKAIQRSGIDKTTRARAGIITNHLESLVKTGKMTSRSGMGRDKINQTIDQARELARRKILADEIGDMKRKLPGYLSGDESASRNQFGSYLKSDDAKGLTNAEQGAFGKVVRREGFLNAAHMGGSRLGQLAASQGGGAVGALAGSVLGPVGTAGGYLLGAAGGTATNIGFRKIMDKITEKAVDDALKTVLAGREAQKMATSAADKEKLRAAIRAALTAESATAPVRQDLVVQDAPPLPR